MDLRTWILQNNCLDKIKKYGHIQSSIYVVDIDHKKYFIKKLKDQTEYQITKELETLCLPTFQTKSLLLPSKIRINRLLRTISNIPTEKKKIYYYMVSEEIKGTTFLDELQNINKEDLENILEVIFFSLQKAWRTLGFVHLDLHLENIILQKINHPMIIDQDQAVTHYLPVIIDFDRSITKSNMNQDYDHKSIFNDIWKILGILSLYLKDERGEMVLDYLEFFIDRYEYQERKEEFINLWFNVLPYEIDKI